MAKFYFTYGLGGQPFSGGWTEIEAPDRKTACVMFRAIHPDKIDGLLNCSSVYSEEEFMKTRMAGPLGNFNCFCQEKISLRREVVVNHQKTFYTDLLSEQQEQM